MKTTLNKIRSHAPCTSGWEKLLTYLGKTKADDEPLAITTIIDSNGLDDALWCLRAVEGYDRELRLFAVWCARQVQHVMTDQRSLDALDVAERYANDQATNDELAAAWSAARAAAWDAVWSVSAARSVSAAAWSASRSAAARATAPAAADAADAAWTAAMAADKDAGHEMKKKQEAELRRICEVDLS